MKKAKETSNVKNISIIFLSFAVGGLLMYILINEKESFVPKFSENRYTDEYEYISPLLECDTYESNELAWFDNKIENKAEELMSNGNTTHISYYFRDLNNGIWFGINEKELFSPASLFKTPVMISYLKQAEENPELLSRKIVFTEADKNYEKQNIKPATEMEIGKSYTIEEVINRMIIYSDNSALRILLREGDSFAYRVFYDLDVGIKSDEEGLENFMSVYEYSRFFRILYNGSYLNFENSNKALELLTKVEFKDGLVAGVPSDIPVAHKFGERQFGEEKQLHDCGIVYHPEKPYLLCVMTRGKDLSTLPQVISELSKVTYEEVSKSQ
jgi:beta-lactamase class A